MMVNWPKVTYRLTKGNKRFREICHRQQFRMMLSKARAADGREFHSVCASPGISLLRGRDKVCREVRDHAAGFKLRWRGCTLSLSMPRCATMNRSAVTAQALTSPRRAFAAGLGHAGVNSVAHVRYMRRCRLWSERDAGFGTSHWMPRAAKTYWVILCVRLQYEGHEESEEWRVELVRGVSAALFTRRLNRQSSDLRSAGTCWVQHGVVGLWSFISPLSLFFTT